MPKKLLLVPPDTRPPTLHFPETLAKAAGYEVAIPPPSALNNLNQPGNFDALKDWLQTQVKDADVLILSLEQLCLGGMIPARRVNDSLEQVFQRLELLRELKQQRPLLRILAGGVIVRVAHGNDPLEEKPYYGEYGNQLRAYSEAFDRFERSHTRELEEKLWQVTKSIPNKILSDWLTTRQRNYAMHVQALELVRKGVIEHLCLTLDDTTLFGLASYDRRNLEKRVDEAQLWSKVDIYPGADEVPVTLLARALQETPTKVYVRYSSTNGANAGLIFEDRPAGELIKAHLRAAYCVQVDTLSEADVVLAVNTPALTQSEERPDFLNVDTAARHLPEFIDFINKCLGTNKPISIADIAYPNGAEQRLMQLLDTVPLHQLAGFAAWNTAGNTLGSAIAMAVVARFLQDKEAWLETLFSRFVDDYLYQTFVREEVRRSLHADPFDLGEKRSEAERQIAERMEPLAQAVWQKHFAATGYGLEWGQPSLVWPRLFTGVFPFRLKM
jgi:Protein of unknown function (DUF4127)